MAGHGEEANSSQVCSESAEGESRVLEQGIGHKEKCFSKTVVKQNSGSPERMW